MEVGRLCVLPGLVDGHAINSPVVMWATELEREVSVETGPFQVMTNSSNTRSMSSKSAMASIGERCLLQPRGQSPSSPFSEVRAQTPCRGCSGLVQALVCLLVSVCPSETPLRSILFFLDPRSQNRPKAAETQSGA